MVEFVTGIADGVRGDLSATNATKATIRRAASGGSI
jgi:hypothetical protein